MLSLRQVFLISLAATSVVADYASVLAKLKDPVDAVDIPRLKNAINAYPNTGSAGAGNALLVIQTANKKLVDNVNLVTADAQGSTAPTSAQAQPVLDYIKGTLLTDTKSTLQALDARQANLIANGVKSTVRTELNKTKNAIDALGAELIAKAPTTAQKNDGTATLATYDSEFNSRIAAYA